MANRKPTDFKFARWTGSANGVAQVLLLLLLFGGISYFGAQYFNRVDLSRQHRYSLSPETAAYLAQLKRPVQIYVTITSDHEDPNLESLYNDVRGLLREYEYAARTADGRMIDVEFINIYQQRTRASFLAKEYGVEQSDLIL